MYKQMLQLRRQSKLKVANFLNQTVEIDEFKYLLRAIDFKFPNLRNRWKHINNTVNFNYFLTYLVLLILQRQN